MIDAKAYFERFATLISQYELATRAVDGFQGSEEAMQRFLERELDDLRDIVANAFNWQRDLYNHWVFSEQGAESYLTSAKVGICDRLKEVHLRLRQNHVVLLITFLEACLKDVHRAILVENPTLLRMDRQISLDKLISSSIEKILEEEIRRDVMRVDQLPVGAKAKYFDETLNLSWYGDPVTHMLEDAVKLRNRIVHDDTDAEVTELDVNNARMVSMAVPLACITQASVLYPEVFKPLSKSNEEMRSTMIRKGRLLRKVPIRARNASGRVREPK